MKLPIVVKSSPSALIFHQYHAESLAHGLYPTYHSIQYLGPQFFTIRDAQIYVWPNSK